MIQVNPLFNEPFWDGQVLDIDSSHIFYETLVDQLFNIFGKTLLNKTDDLDQVFNNISNFCRINNIDINLEIDNTYNIPYGILAGNTIHIKYSKDCTSYNILYVLLHEISHVITNNSSNGRLLNFLKDPNTINVNINDINSLKKELDYILSPGERSNWAFSLALNFHEVNIILPSQIYQQIKNEFKINPSNIIFDLDSYKSIDPKLKSFYHVCWYLLRLQYLTHDKSIYNKLKVQLGKFISLLEKYIKRLRILFKQK